MTSTNDHLEHNFITSGHDPATSSFPEFIHALFGILLVCFLWAGCTKPTPRRRLSCPPDTEERILRIFTVLRESHEDDFPSRILVEPVEGSPVPKSDAEPWSAAYLKLGTLFLVHEQGLDVWWGNEKVASARSFASDVPWDAALERANQRERDSVRREPSGPSAKSDTEMPPAFVSYMAITEGVPVAHLDRLFRALVNHGRSTIVILFRSPTESPDPPRRVAKLYEELKGAHDRRADRAERAAWLAGEMRTATGQCASVRKVIEECRPEEQKEFIGSLAERIHEAASRCGCKLDVDRLAILLVLKYRRPANRVVGLEVTLSVHTEPLDVTEWARWKDVHPHVWKANTKRFWIDSKGNQWNLPYSQLLPRFKKVGRITVSGGLQEAEVRTALERIEVDLGHCLSSSRRLYDRRVLREVKVAFTVTGGGKVENARVVRSDMSTKLIDLCLVRVLGRAKLPQPSRLPAKVEAILPHGFQLGPPQLTPPSEPSAREPQRPSEPDLAPELGMAPRSGMSPGLGTAPDPIGPKKPSRGP